MDHKSDNSKNLVDLAAFRAKKQIKDDLANGRTPLFISHLDGKMSGSPHFDRPKADDFGDRLGRIRSSLEKINRLMAELKKISTKEEKEKVADNTVSILSRQ